MIQKRSQGAEPSRSPNFVNRSYSDGEIWLDQNTLRMSFPIWLGPGIISCVFGRPGQRPYGRRLFHISRFIISAPPSRADCLPVPDTFVVQMLGHSSTNILPSYAKAIDEFRRDAIRKLDEMRKTKVSATATTQPVPPAIN